MGFLKKLIVFSNHKRKKSEDDELSVMTEAPSHRILVDEPDLSSLQDPTQKLGTMVSDTSLAAYDGMSISTGQNQSTVFGGSTTYGDSTTYMGGESDDVTISSAGTWGNATMGGYTTVTDSSFEAYYRQQQGGGLGGEILEIHAPPGKLGMSIDTPADGDPVVHAIKECSIIADKLKVGDRIIAVDDEIVRDYTALQISKLLSRKANATRKITVIRNNSL